MKFGIDPGIEVCWPSEVGVALRKGEVEAEARFTIRVDGQEVAAFDSAITNEDLDVFTIHDRGHVEVEVVQRNSTDVGEAFLAWVHSFVDFDLMKRFQESVPFIRGNPSHPSNHRLEQTKRNQSFSRKRRLLKQIALCKRKG